MTPDQAKSFLEENDVKFVLAQFVDIHGVAICNVGADIECQACVASLAVFPIQPILS